MKVLVHLPEGAVPGLYAVSVEMPAVPRVGDLLGLSQMDEWLVVESVRWEIYTTAPIAVAAEPDVFCAYPTEAPA
ncbi:hypothetical protein [Mycobacterium sp. NPDC004974]